MKSLHNAVVTAVSLALFASSNAETAPALPKDAETLRKSFREARQRAVLPLEQRYRSDLEKLLSAHTKAGHLNEALAIRQELEELAAMGKGDAVQPNKVEIDPGPSKAKLKSALPNLRLDGKWQYGVFPVVFTETEAVLNPGNKAFERKGAYEVTAPRKIRITFGPDGAAQKGGMVIEIELSKDMAEFTSTNRKDLSGKVTATVKQ